MSSRYTIDTQTLRVRDVFAINSSNGDYITNSYIPNIGPFGQLLWYSQPQLLSTIYISSVSSSVWDILNSTQPSFSTISTLDSLFLKKTLASTLQGVGTAGYLSSVAPFLVSSVGGLGSSKYISSSSLNSTVRGLGSSSYISTTALNSTVTGLGTSGYISTNYALSNTIPIGCNAGINNQGYTAVAIGYDSGTTNQGIYAVAIGGFSGYTNQGKASVAIGNAAGRNFLGDCSIAIGVNAGVHNQSANSILLNASSNEINPATTGFFVNPLRFLGSNTSISTTNVIAYNAQTSEVFYTDSVTVSSLFTHIGVQSNGTFLTSDSNVKENIVNANLALCYSNVKQLPLRRFNYISSFASSKIDQTQLGFIAQEAQLCFPKSIYSTFDVFTSSQILHLNSDQILMSHYGATQMLISTVEGQTTQIQTLTTAYESLVTQVNSLISRLN